MTAADVLRTAKLVVWDLDGTLWRGTLDEDHELAPTGLHEWIVPLARAGVMSAVCSNNDAERATAALATLGLAEWVVFPTISWEPKTRMLRDLVVDVQLRPSDIVYVDDLARLRAFAADELGLQVLDPVDIEPYTGQVSSEGDADRLEHYRTLERRTRARSNHPTEPEDFLRRSRVRVAITPVLGHEARVSVLSQRSNQLNFTGSRLTPEEVGALALDSGTVDGAVWVSDDHGDYGLAGYFAQVRGGQLLHYFLSCRVLQLGVESFVHARLGRPELARRSTSVTADRWRELSKPVDWIVLADAPPAAATTRPPTFWAGGCDLQVLAGLVGAESAADEWLLPAEQGGAQVYARSSLLALLASPDQRTVQRAVPWLAGTGGLPEGGAWQAMVLSPWVDCASWTYLHRPTGTRLPSFVELGAASDEWTWQHWWGDNPGREQFLDDHTIGPPLQVGEVEALLLQLAERLAGRGLLVMTVPEIESGRTYPWGELQHERHATFNGALEAVAHRASNVSLLDVRRWVATTGDLHRADDPILFHYSRRCYRDLAREATLALRAPLAAS